METGKQEMNTAVAHGGHGVVKYVSSEFIDAALQKQTILPSHFGQVSTAIILKEDKTNL